MPELITPPRRSSTSAAIRPSSAGSKGAAVRMTRTPPRVSSSVRWESTMAPRFQYSGPRRRPGKKKRPPVLGRSLLSLLCGTNSLSQRAASWRRHHCKLAVLVTRHSVADRPHARYPPLGRADRASSLAGRRGSVLGDCFADGGHDFVCPQVQCRVADDVARREQVDESGSAVVKHGGSQFRCPLRHCAPDPAAVVVAGLS